jgi:signal transduction histidine kinase
MEPISVLMPLDREDATDRMAGSLTSGKTASMAQFLSDEQGEGIGGDARLELYHFLDRALFWLEAATILVLLLITLAQPRTSLVGLPTWGIVLLFAGHSLLADLIQNRAHSLRALRWKYIADLPVTAVAYLLAGEPGGPLFVLFILAVDCAAATMAPRGALLYTAAAVAAVGTIDVVLLSDPPSAAALPSLITRLVVLALVGLGMVVVMRRLLLEREASRSARGEAERLAELDRLRADFISSVSHDLRTPLTASRAGLGMLEMGITNQLLPDERALLSDARRNIDLLGMMIDELLAINQLQFGTMQIEHEPLDLAIAITGAVSTVQSLIRTKGQALEMDVTEPMPVVGDPRQLEQLILNLLANAHQHTPTGTDIVISGRVSSSYVALSVCDQGPGIPAGDLETIFERHRRLTGTGSGLGLTIAKGIVELHGGRSWAESEPGRGASIHVVLPRSGNKEKK